MPVKILLADKSITIQKVVEMLFSGKEYAVMPASDGDTALQEAARVQPDIVLADVDLPRVDGYSLSARFKQDPRLAAIPVILMLSRDDTYDEAKGRRAGVVDFIAKPFESQELIGKVKKALSAAPATVAEAAAPAKQAAPPKPVTPLSVQRPAPAAPQQKAIPSDILDIIQEAPTRAALSPTATPPPPAAEQPEEIYEVEPELEMEEPLGREGRHALPIGERAREEMRESLGLGGVPTEADLGLGVFGAAAEKPAPGRAAGREEFAPWVAPQPPQPPAAAVVTDEAVRSAAEKAVSRIISEETVKMMAEHTVTRFTQDYFNALPAPQPPAVPDEVIRKGIEEAVSGIVRDLARGLIEKVAWEVIPQLAEMILREEIEKFKKETMPE